MLYAQNAAHVIDVMSNVVVVLLDIQEDYVRRYYCVRKVLFLHSIVLTVNSFQITVILVSGFMRVIFFYSHRD